LAQTLVAFTWLGGLPFFLISFYLPDHGVGVSREQAQLYREDIDIKLVLLKATGVVEW